MDLVESQLEFARKNFRFQKVKGEKVEGMECHQTVVL